MNTEPPTGDDLRRMLVAMKQNVLERAEPPARPVRRRHVGLVIGLVVILVGGTAGGAYALGLVPQDLFAAPVATASPSPSPTPHPEASAPVTAAPTAPPSPPGTASAAPTKQFALDDPSTWTISFTEVGPVALGAPYDGEVDDLTSTYVRDSLEECPNPNVSIWHRDGTVPIVVTEDGGVVSGVAIAMYGADDPSNLTTSPTTADGTGVGSTLDELRAMYPDIRRIGTTATDDGSGAFDLWSIEQAGHAITFGLDFDGVHVGEVWVGTDPRPPYEFCG